MSIIKWFWFLTLLCLTSGCITVTSYDLKNTELYYPPNVKYIDQKRFAFSMAERMLAIKKLHEADADTLFELIIDREGNVVKGRLIKTHVRECYHEDVENHAMILKFTPQKTAKPYRTFYYPVKYRYNSTFEWM